jgi:hypothetical protein
VSEIAGSSGTAGRTAVANEPGMQTEKSVMSPNATEFLIRAIGIKSLRYFFFSFFEDSLSDDDFDSEDLLSDFSLFPLFSPFSLFSDFDEELSPDSAFSPAAREEFLPP